MELWKTRLSIIYLFKDNIKNRVREARTLGFRDEGEVGEGGKNKKTKRRGSRKGEREKERDK